MYGLQEELAAAWAGQLREKRREPLRVLGARNPREEVIAMADGGPDGSACLRFRNVFNFDALDGRCQTVCAPPQERRASRYLAPKMRDSGPKGPTPGAQGP
eukprot:6754917-Pyramimonas_sp.AAC.1